MRISYLQMNCVFNGKESNLEKVSTIMQANRSDLWVLPELFNTGYLFSAKDELEELSEEIPSGRSICFLQKMSENYNTAIVAGIAEKEGSAYFNSAVYVYRGEYIATYRKIHLFDREKLWFTPGNNKFEVHPLGEYNIGIMICYDWIYPEAARSLANMGADIICHPSNLVLPYCQNAMITRCIENRVFAITANRIGTEQKGELGLTFTGKSQITAADGKILKKAGYNTEEVGSVEIDPHDARCKDMTDRNHIFRDRKPEYYHL